MSIFTENRDAWSKGNEIKGAKRGEQSTVRWKQRDEQRRRKKERNEQVLYGGDVKEARDLILLVFRIIYSFGKNSSFRRY